MWSWTDDNKKIDCFWEDRSLLSYVYRPSVPKSQSPKPSFHPVKTLKGVTVTDHQPDDHPWHHGLSMTLTLVGDQNFWGGPTYDQSDGYVDRKNQGSQDHREWIEVSETANTLKLIESLAWNSFSGSQLLVEQRTWSINVSESDHDFYRIDFDSAITNVSKRELRLDTYASRNGLVDSPYTGLQWRGQHDFLNGNEAFESMIWAGETEGEASIHNKRLPWMAVSGSASVNCPATLLFMDHPDNTRYPGTFFCRKQSSQVAFSFIGQETYVLLPDQTLRLQHRIVIADGRWDQERIKLHIKDNSWS